MVTRLKPIRVKSNNDGAVGSELGYLQNDKFIWEGDNIKYGAYTRTETEGEMGFSVEITPTEDFTIYAPETIKEGQVYILRVNNTETTYEMTLGEGITDPRETDLTLTSSATDMFVFLAVNGFLELQKEASENTITGPSASVDGNIAVFDGTSGSRIKDGGTSITEINERISRLEGIGRYLSDWDCETGLAVTPPTEGETYTYKAGDYFEVANVGETNYRPEGTQYVIPEVPSTTIETGAVTVGSRYKYDGSQRILQVIGGVASFSSITGDPYDNTALGTELNSKLDKTTDINKVYGTNSSGQQTEISYSLTATASTIPLRGTGGVVSVGTPTDNTHAATKKYVDDSIADIVIPEPITPGNGQLIIQKNGTAITPTGGTFTANKSTNSTVNITVPVDDVQVDNTSVVDSNGIAKIDLSGKLNKVSTTNKLYATNSSGAQTTIDYSQSATADTVVQRGAGGVVKVGTPTANDDATTKKYVDDGLNTKQPTLVSGTNIKTINGNSIVGSGNIEISTIIKSNTQPTNPNDGDVWYNTYDSTYYAYIDGMGWYALSYADTAEYSYVNQPATIAWDTKYISHNIGMESDGTTITSISTTGAVMRGRTYVFYVKNTSDTNDMYIAIEGIPFVIQKDKSEAISIYYDTIDGTYKAISGTDNYMTQAQYDKLAAQYSSSMGGDGVTRYIYEVEN